MSDLDRLIDALAECIVARQGLPNRDRAKAVLATIEAQGLVLVSGEALVDAADEIDRLRAKVRFWQELRTKGQAAVEIEKLRAACQLMIDGKWNRACTAARAALAGET